MSITINRILQSINGAKVNMGLINGSLSNDLAKFHEPGIAELGLMVIDEKGEWPKTLTMGEIEKDQNKRQQDQSSIIASCMNLGCKVIVVEMHPTFKTAGYIHSALKDYPKDIFVKDRHCAISHRTKHVHKTDGVIQPISDSKSCLYDFISNNKITSLVVIGGHKNACVDATVNGGIDSYFDDENYCYSGLKSMGITVLSSISLLAPYMPQFDKTQPLKVDSITRDNEDKIIKSIDPDYSWPRMLLTKGCRIYTDV